MMTIEDELNSSMDLHHCASGCGKMLPASVATCPDCERHDVVRGARVFAGIALEFRPCPGGCGIDTLRGIRCADCEDRRSGRMDERQAINEAKRSIPKEYADASFSAIDVLRERVQPVEAIALAAAAVGSPRFVLVGPAGSGKTTLAVAILRAWMDAHRKPGTFFHACDLAVARVQFRMGNGEPPLVDEALAVPIALLDDIDEESRTPTNAVPDIIRKRHASMRPTIITTGQDEDGIARLYGDGVCRRVFEGAKVISLGVAPRGAT